MVQGKPVDPALVRAVNTSYACLRSQRNVARILGLSRGSVRNIRSRYDSVSGLPRSRQMSGVQPKTTAQEDQKMLDYVYKNFTGSLRNLTAAMHLNPDLPHVSKATLWRRLKKEGWTNVNAVRDDLTEDHKLARFLYSKERLQQYRSWEKRPLSEINQPSPFYKILYSDEAYFRLRGGKVKIWKPPYIDADNPDFQVPRVRQDRCGIMVWAMIGPEGGLALRILKGNQNSDKYLEIITEELIPILEEIGHDYIFQQDNCSIHVSHQMQAFFNQEGILTEDWPARSPDLNVIENLWHSMKMYVTKYQPKNVLELEQLIREAFVMCATTQYCQNLYKSIPNRLEKVISNAGYKTPY